MKADMGLKTLAIRLTEWRMKGSWVRMGRRKSSRPKTTKTKMIYSKKVTTRILIVSMRTGDGTPTI